MLDGYKHYRINHSKEFANKNNHINGIENFWGWSKVRLAKFRGLNRKSFYLHLKECEFRFNYRDQNLYLKILALNLSCTQFSYVLKFIKVANLSCLSLKRVSS